LEELGWLRNRGNNGLTLVEVVLSIGILAVGVTAVIQGISFCVRTSAVSSDMVKAVFLAEDILQNLDFLAQTSQQIDVSFANKTDNLAWRYNTIDLQDGSGLRQIELALEWERLNTHQNFTILTYLSNFGR